MSDRKKSLEGEMGSGDSDDEFYNVKLPCAPALSSHKQNARQEIKKIYSPSSTRVKYDYKFDSSSDDECDEGNAGGSGKSRSHPPVSGNESGAGERGATRKEDAPAKTTNATTLPPSTYMVVEKINEELKNLKKSGGKANAEHAEGTGTCKSHVAPGGTALASPMGLVPPVVVVPSPVAVGQSPVVNMGPLMVQSSVGMTGQNLIPRHMLTVPGNVLTSSNPMGGMMTSPNGSMPNSMMAINRMKGHMPAVVGLPGNVVNTTMQAAMQENMMRMAAAAAAAGNNMLNMPGPGNAVVGVQGGIAGPGSNIMLAVPSSEAVAVPSPGLLVNPGGVMSNPAGLMVVGGVMNNVGASTVPKANTLPKPGSAGPTNAGLIRMGGNLPGHQTVRPVPPPPPPFLSARHRPPIPSNLQWPTNAKASFAAGSSNASAPLAEAKKASTCGPDDEVQGDDAQDSCRRSQCGSESPPTKDLPFAFKNDGSFMEMFKKMKSELNPEPSSKEKGSGSESNEKSGGGLKKAPVILSGLVGKRRGGRVLKTGLVKKVKKEGEAEEEKRPKDAWSMYMAEVKKYREASCEEEGKTRPLVK